MAVNTQLQVRRGTASQWTSTNPTLAAGEFGFETDTGKFKIGTGSTAWTSLGYAATDGDITSVTAGTGLSGGGTSGGVTLSIDTTATADLSTAQTLTNKTINFSNNTLTGTVSEFNTALSDGDFATLSGTETLTNKSLTSPIFSGTTKIQQILEKATVSETAATGTINYDLLTNGGVTYYTSNASANWTLNIRGDGSTTLNSAMETGQSLTIAFLVTNGSTPYYQSGFQIDGNAVTPKWQGGTAISAGNQSSIDIYTITIIKTGNATYTAFAAQTKFA